MKITDLMVRQGNWLFRRRSYLPLLLLGLALPAMWLNRENYGNEYVLFDLLCLLLSALGETIRIITVGYAAERTSGRNTRQQVADEINQTGLYSLVRHPLYIGNFLIWSGIALFCRVWWLFGIFLFIYWLYYERIIAAEEDFLQSKFGEAYGEYAGRVNCLIPRWKNYRPPRYRFRPLRVLRQENSAIFGTILTFVAVELFQDYISGGSLHPELHWLILGGLGLSLYLVVRWLKKKTRILHGDRQLEKTQ